MTAQAGYQISSDCMDLATEYFEKQCLNKESTYANARGVRNFFEKAAVNQANRLVSADTFSRETLTTIEAEDVLCISPTI